MHLNGKTVSFALANTAAVLVALFIAFASDLERPYWAMFTVFIVAQPITGAVRSKAAFRFLGTLAGAAISLLLVPPLVHAPVLLSVATSLWIGLCLYFSLLDRRPRSYAFMLAGYTAAIVGLAVVNTPERIFDTSVARVEEISLGIVCAAVAHSVFFPQNILDALLQRIDGALQRSGTWIADALARQESSDIEGELKLSALVSDLYILYEHVAFETSDVPRNASTMEALQDRLALVLPRISSIQAAFGALTAGGPISRSTSEVMEAASRWARSYPTHDGRGGLALEKDLHAALARLSSESEGSVEWSALLQRTIATQVRELVLDLSDAAQLAAELRNPERARVHGTPVGPPSRRTLPRDRGLALLSACAAAAATLIACALWIYGSWPEGALAAEFAAIGCSLFATLDYPSKQIFGAIAGIVLALPLAAAYEFAILPRIDGFTLLALVLAPVVLLFSWLQTVERFEGLGLVMAIGFSGGLALQPSYHGDFAGFINAFLAAIAGLLIAVVANLAFRTIDPVWNARRISSAGWRAVARLAQAPKSDVRPWTLQMFDRLGQVTTRLLAAKRADLLGREIDGLRDVRVGLNVATLQRSADALPAAARRSLELVLEAVSAAYTGLMHGKSLRSQHSALSIDEGIDALWAQMPSHSVRDRLAALIGLRLDLAPSGTRYSRQLVKP